MLRLRTLLFGLVVLVLLLLHRESLASMVHSWITNSTYNQGFAILIIAAFFAGQHREDSLARPAEAWWPRLLAAEALTALWSVAMLVNVMVVAQLATVGLVVATTATMLGPQHTADFTVAGLELIGIRVIRDGLYFSIPSGNFEVAGACSGVHYLLASVAAGVGSAFLMYSRWKKRLLFIIASIIVLIIANSLSAVDIVLIAHYSELRYATGIDHFIYGWFFFGVVIAMLFVIGFRYADTPVHVTTATVDAARVSEDQAIGERRRQPVRVPA